MNTTAAILMTAATYINDAAVLALALCGLTLFIAAGRTWRMAMPDDVARLASLREKLRRPVVAAVALISATAVPRIFFFAGHEYAQAAEGLAIGRLITRHLMMLLVLLTGISCWNSGSRRLKRISPAGTGSGPRG